jgi:hypothetical protein
MPERTMVDRIVRVFEEVDPETAKELVNDSLGGGASASSSSAPPTIPFGEAPTHAAGASSDTGPGIAGASSSPSQTQSGSGGGLTSPGSIQPREFAWEPSSGHEVSGHEVSERGPRRFFSKAFKDKVVAEAEKGEMLNVEIEAKYELTKGTLTKWLKDAGKSNPRSGK